MEKELTKKEINKAIGEATKSLNNEDKSILIITEKMVTAKGELVEIMALVAKFLKELRKKGTITKIAVDSLVDEIIRDQKKDKKPEDMTTEELVEELKKTLEGLKELVD